MASTTGAMHVYKAMVRALRIAALGVLIDNFWFMVSNALLVNSSAAPTATAMATGAKTEKLSKPALERVPDAAITRLVTNESEATSRTI